MHLGGLRFRFGMARCYAPLARGFPQSSRDIRALEGFSPAVHGPAATRGPPHVCVIPATAFPFVRWLRTIARLVSRPNSASFLGGCDTARLNTVIRPCRGCSVCRSPPFGGGWARGENPHRHAMSGVYPTVPQGPSQPHPRGNGSEPFCIPPGRLLVCWPNFGVASSASPYPRPPCVSNARRRFRHSPSTAPFGTV